MTHKKITVLTIIIWFCITSVYAFFYVKEKLLLPDLVGYEKEWDWQLLFFSLEKLPFLIILLVLILLIEYFIKRWRS